MPGRLSFCRQIHWFENVMALSRRRRFRRPVLSRLTWAWLAFTSAVAVFAGLVFFVGDHWPVRIALPISGQAERMASPSEGVIHGEDASQTGMDEVIGVRLASGLVLRDDQFSTDGDVPGEDFVDVFAPPDEQLVLEKRDLIDLEEAPEGELIITVDGKNIDDLKTSALSEAPLKPAHSVTPIAGPDLTLLQKTQYGDIPRIGPGGRASVESYARPFDLSERRPKVAIIVGGLGLNEALTQRAIDNLPPEVTLAFAPYAQNLKVWTDKARLSGHEIIVELPMEGYGTDSSALGSAALMSGRPSDQNLQRLDWVLSRFSGYFAVTNYQGGKFSADAEAMAPILARLRETGLAYIDDTGAIRSAFQETGGIGVSVNRVIAPVGETDSRTMLLEDLEALERIARRDGDALGKTYAYAANIDEVDRWASTMEARGLALAPASAVLRIRTRAR